MKRTLTILVTLFSSVLLLAQQATDSKLSLWLQESLEHHKTLRRTANEEPKLTTTFLRTTEGMTDQMLLQYDCKVYARLGDICIVTVPVDRLPELAQDEQV